MGEKKLIRAVIDTNVFISAVLFKGKISPLVDHWKEQRFHFLISKEILEEYIRVLSYPKFKLTSQEIHVILNEWLLPFVTIVNPAKIELGQLRDPKDLDFIACAFSSNANYLVTGDLDLLEYKVYQKKFSFSIISAAKFLEKLIY